MFVTQINDDFLCALTCSFSFSAGGAELSVGLFRCCPGLLKHQLHQESLVCSTTQAGVYCILSYNSHLWLGLAPDTITNLFPLNPAEWFPTTARICGGDLVLSFEAAGCFTANTLQKLLQQRKAFTSFIALFDNVCMLSVFCSGRCEKPLER